MEFHGHTGQEISLAGLAEGRAALRGGRRVHHQSEEANPTKALVAAFVVERKGTMLPNALHHGQ